MLEYAMMYVKMTKIIIYSHIQFCIYWMVKITILTRF